MGTGGHGAMEDHGDMRIVEWKKRESSREWMGISGLLGLSLVLDHSPKFPMFSTSKTDREGTNLKSLFLNCTMIMPITIIHAFHKLETYMLYRCVCIYI